MEGRPLEDRELTRRAKRGDLDAFEALVRLHQQAAYRLAFVVTGSAHDAEDVAQEAFMSAYLALGRFRDGVIGGQLVLQLWACGLCHTQARAGLPYG